MAKEMEESEEVDGAGQESRDAQEFIRIVDDGDDDHGLAPAKGTAEIGWLMEGRWLQMDVKSVLFGQPFRKFSIMGYDNFKKSFVTTTVSTFDTAMIQVEGDLDQHGTSLVSYGVLDEYLTGEINKPIKVAWRFKSDDQLVMEVHDFGIGETNTKVFEIVYNRKK
jgi:hypothetical protein